MADEVTRASARAARGAVHRASALQVSTMRRNRVRSSSPP
jgi:hypothetical protein